MERLERVLNAASLWESVWKRISAQVSGFVKILIGNNVRAVEIRDGILILEVFWTGFDSVQENLDWITDTVIEVSGGAVKTVEVRKNDDRSAAVAIVKSQQELAIKTSLRPARFHFGNLVFGPHNAEAVLAIHGLIHEGQGRFNPIFVSGGSGLGKTHLLRATQHLLLGMESKGVALTSGGDFLRAFTGAAERGEFRDFDRFFSPTATRFLLVDDLQDLRGPRTTARFVAIIKAVLEKDGRVIIAGRSRDGLPVDLASLLVGGLTCEVSLPDLESRQEIVHIAARGHQVRLAEPVARFLAANFTSDVRSLVGAVNQVVAFQLFSNRGRVADDLDMIRRRLDGMIPAAAVRQLTVADIVAAVAAEFRVSEEALRGRLKAAKFVFPRQVAMYLARELLSLSYPLIGQEFGGRDHSTAIAAVEKMKALEEADEKTRLLLGQLRGELAR